MIKPNLQEKPMSAEEILIVDYYKGVIKKQIDELENKKLPAKKND